MVICVGSGVVDVADGAAAGVELVETTAVVD